MLVKDSKLYHLVQAAEPKPKPKPKPKGPKPKSKSRGLQEVVEGTRGERDAIMFDDIVDGCQSVYMLAAMHFKFYEPVNTCYMQGLRLPPGLPQSQPGQPQRRSRRRQHQGCGAGGGRGGIESMPRPRIEDPESVGKRGKLNGDGLS